MFALSYTSRCFLCRALFVAGCVVPTTSVLLYAGWLKLPGHVIGYARMLEQQLRMHVEVGSVEPLQPGRQMLHGVNLTDRVSGRWLARVPQLEAGRNGSTMVLIASHVEINGKVWGRLLEVLDDHAGRSIETITLSASRVNWHVGDEVMQVEQLAARLKQGETGPVCDVSFRLNDRRAADPVRLGVARVRDGERQLTGYEIDTGDLHIPCSLALPALPWLARLGPRAEFSGHAIVYHGEDGWQGELRGRLRNVDLRQLVSEPLGHELHGLAELRIERARFDRSRLTEASGTLTAGPGMIGSSLRLAAIRWLTPLSSPPAQAPELLAYDELAAQFTINSAGLKLTGACEQGTKGAVLCDRGQPLLGTSPQGEHVPLANLIQTLAPPSDALVPAGRQTGWLLEVLPTP